MSKSLVIGLGKSGLAAYDFLTRKGDEVVGFDDNCIVAQKAADSGRRVESMPQITEFDRLILSPGVALEHLLVAQAQELGITLVGEAELALQHMQGPAVGVTGTNGKTTVTLLITHALQTAGLQACALGNVGIPLTSHQSSLEEIAVVELSSFQLDTLHTHAFDMGVILNITPDHLDRYESMHAYAKSKCHLQDCLKPTGELWVHESVVHDFKDCLKPFYKSYGQNRDCTLSGDDVAFLRNLWGGRGTHDLENAMAAWVICRQLGVAETIFLDALRSFKKPAHRIEEVGSIAGVEYINDSKGTNVDATIKAVECLQKSVILIVGGVDKGASYEVWKKRFSGRVRAVVAIGEAAPKIIRELRPDYEVLMKASLMEAVLHCREIAREGEVILLSPGCSSYDMFRDYVHRGEEFKRIFDLLKEKEG